MHGYPSNADLRKFLGEKKKKKKCEDKKLTVKKKEMVFDYLVVSEAFNVFMAS